jgi:hypothetical protein
MPYANGPIGPLFEYQNIWISIIGVVFHHGRVEVIYKQIQGMQHSIINAKTTLHLRIKNKSCS